MGTEIGILLLLVSGSAIEAVPTLTIQPAAPNAGSTLTLTCELAGFTTDLMNFNKDGTSPYTCALGGGQTCDDIGGISDYSEVDWSQTYKGIITLSNANQTRDGGDWTCAIGGVGGGTSVAVTLEITDANCGNPTKPTNGQVSLTTTATTYQSTATYSCDPGYTIDGTDNTTCQADGTWSGSVPTCAVSQAGCSAWVILGSIYGTLWILAIVDLLVLYCTDQERLPWNLSGVCCDGLVKKWWIWILLFIVVPFVTFVVAICRFITKRPSHPLKPTDVTVITSATTYVTLSWKPGFDGGAAQTFSIQYRKDGGSDFSNYRNTFLNNNRPIMTAVVDGLEEGSVYYFRLIATNRSGESPVTEETSSTTVKPTSRTRPGNNGEPDQSLPLLNLNQ